jgi:hypothetical protein
MFKINIHSIVDVITNSSTTIYTYQDNVKEAKELLQEVLSLLGSKENVDDVFGFGVFLDDTDYYIESLDERDDVDGWDDFNWEEKDIYISKLQLQIVKKEVHKPNWMIEIEKDMSEDSYEYAKGTSLHIHAKNDKFTSLAEKALAFLNSSTADGGFDG